MADEKTTRTTAQRAEQSDVNVERPDTSVDTAGNDSSAKELKAVLTFKEDADIHPTGEPDSDTEKEPGGPPATDPNRPPFATNRPDEKILTSLATGSGEHTPPDPDTVDGDGFVRPLAAEQKNKA